VNYNDAIIIKIQNLVIKQMYMRQSIRPRLYVSGLSYYKHNSFRVIKEERFAL